MRAATRKRAKFWGGIAFTITMTMLAVGAAWRIMAEVRWNDVGDQIMATGWLRFGIAMAVTAVCYFTLSEYDAIALRSLGRPLPRRRSISGSTTAYALSHNLGFAPVTATFARTVVYRHDGIGMADAARIVVLTGTAFWLGVILMLGICLLVAPDMIAQAVPPAIAIVCGIAAIGAVAAYLGIIATGRPRIGLRSWSLPLPTLPDAIRQILISMAETTMAALVIWVLMPGVGVDTYPEVLVAYVAAFTAVLLMHTPGGAGVLETVILLMLPDLAKTQVISALILFRIVFHLMPLCAAAVILISHRRSAPT